jgi:hypothetical protein
VHSRFPIAVAAYYSCQRGSGGFGGPRPAHYNQDFSTSSHVQLSGLRESSLKPSLKKCFSSDLLMPSCLSRKK